MQQNRESIVVWFLFLFFFLTNGARISHMHTQKMDFDPYPTSYTKLTQTGS